MAVDELELLTAPGAALEALRAAAARSPADETALTLVESWRAAVTAGGAKRGQPRARLAERRVQVRAVEAGRLGAFRTGSLEPRDLEEAVRHAMAHARAAEPLPSGVALTPAEQPSESVALLHDARVAELDAAAAQQQLAALLRDEEWARLAWSETALTVVTSRGFARQLRVTQVALDVRCGSGAGSGSASGAARSLAGLDAPAIVARARRRHGAGEPAAWSAPASLVLAPEAFAVLVATLGHEALSAAAWDVPEAFGPRRRGERVFAPALTVLDDGARAAGLPFPLDLAGAPRRCAPLVADGTLQGPLADPVEAARLGVVAWRPVPTGESTTPEHLFALPGSASEAALLAGAEGGVFVGELPFVECWDDGALALRLAARGLRRVESGALGASLADRTWETTLPAVLAAVRTLGDEMVTVAGGPESTGGTSAPAALVDAVGDWSPA